MILPAAIDPISRSKRHRLSVPFRSIALCVTILLIWISTFSHAQQTGQWFTDNCLYDTIVNPVIPPGQPGATYLARKGCRVQDSEERVYYHDDKTQTWTDQQTGHVYAVSQGGGWLIQSTAGWVDTTQVPGQHPPNFGPRLQPAPSETGSSAVSNAPVPQQSSNPAGAAVSEMLAPLEITMKADLSSAVQRRVPAELVSQLQEKYRRVLRSAHIEGDRETFSLQDTKRLAWDDYWRAHNLYFEQVYGSLACAVREYDKYDCPSRNPRALSYECNLARDKNTGLCLKLNHDGENFVP